MSVSLEIISGSQEVSQREVANRCVGCFDAWFVGAPACAPNESRCTGGADVVACEEGEAGVCAVSSQRHDAFSVGAACGDEDPVQSISRSYIAFANDVAFVSLCEAVQHSAVEREINPGGDAWQHGATPLPISGSSSDCVSVGGAAVIGSQAFCAYASRVGVGSIAFAQARRSWSLFAFIEVAVGRRGVYSEAGATQHSSQVVFVCLGRGSESSGSLAWGGGS